MYGVEEGPDFGMDVAVAADAGAILGEWPDPGVGGSLTGRVDVFPVPSDAPGARVGASVWARAGIWPLQTTTPEDGGPVEFNSLQVGLHAVIRYDPAAKLSGTFGFGFSRLDVDGYDGGFWTVPVFTVEGGLRQGLGRIYLDYGLRSGWGSARSDAGGWEDWYTVGASVGVGVHAR